MWLSEELAFTTVFALVLVISLLPLLLLVLLALQLLLSLVKLLWSVGSEVITGQPGPGSPRSESPSNLSTTPPWNRRLWKAMQCNAGQSSRTIHGTSIVLRSSITTQQLSPSHKSEIRPIGGRNLNGFIIKTLSGLDMFAPNPIWPSPPI